MLTQQNPPMSSRQRRRLANGVVRGLLAIALLAMAGGCGRAHLFMRPSAQPDGWPTVRGAPNNCGATVGGTIIVERLLWRSKTGGEAAGEPTIRDGLLYFPGLNYRLEIFDAANGRRLFRARFNGPVSGALPSSTGFDVLTDQDEQRYFVYLFDPLRVESSFPTVACRAAPRRLDDSTILLAAWNGTVSCLDRSGKSIWSVETEGPIVSTPAVVDSIIYVASGRQVVALARRDGRRIWSHRASGAVVAAPAVDDRVYVGSADSIIYALGRESGSMDWFFAADGGVFTTPTIGPDRICFGANDGAIYALDKSTGRFLWRYDTGAIANLSTTLAGKTLLVGSRRGRLLVLNAADGSLISEHPLSAPAATPPVVAYGRVFIADAKRNLYCFGPATDSVAAREPR